MVRQTTKGAWCAQNLQGWYMLELRQRRGGGAQAFNSHLSLTVRRHRFPYFRADQVMRCRRHFVRPGGVRTAVLSQHLDSTMVRRWLGKFARRVG